MKELYNKKLKQAKWIKSILFGLFITFIFSVIDLLDGLAILTFFIMDILLIVYLMIYYPIEENEKYLRKHGLSDILEDDFPNTPTFPRSKIYCGERAFYYEKAHIVMPYSEIEWCYMQNYTIYIIFTISSFFFFRKDGKGFGIRKPDMEELKEFIRDYIVEEAPEVLIGYNNENKKEYKQRVKQYKSENRRNFTKSVSKPKKVELKNKIKKESKKEISSLNSEVNNKKVFLEKETKSICSFCGKVQPTLGKFCTYCGSPMQKEEVAKERFCSNCGTKVSSQQLFCKECGMKIEF